MHTPSPWTIRAGGYGALFVGPATLPHPGKEMEALAQRRGDSYLARRAADAALIAAAPDMLKAGEALLAAWDAFDVDGPAPLDVQIAALRAAITAARKVA